VGALRAVEQVGGVVAGGQLGGRVRVRVLDLRGASVAAGEEAVPGGEEGCCARGEDHVAGSPRGGRGVNFGFVGGKRGWWDRGGWERKGGMGGG